MGKYSLCNRSSDTQADHICDEKYNKSEEEENGKKEGIHELAYMRTQINTQQKHQLIGVQKLYPCCVSCMRKCPPHLHLLSLWLKKIACVCA